MAFLLDNTVSRTLTSLNSMTVLVMDQQSQSEETHDSQGINTTGKITALQSILKKKKKTKTGSHKEHVEKALLLNHFKGKKMQNDKKFNYQSIYTKMSLGGKKA